MKSLCALFVVVFLCSGTLPVRANPLKEQQQLGATKCTWGPSYWCSDLRSAKDCKAVRHCIQTVWEKQNVPVDNDSICQICKDMVKQARDQLQSNETIEELREVFEGSCNLIPIKVVRKECDKLADDFIPELVEALSSQMNPDQVCSVAGLCNSAKIDKLLMETYSKALDGTLKEESSEAAASTTKDIKKPLSLSCSRCNYVGDLIAENFNTANRDDVLENILRLCGTMSSFSDACSSITLSYFNDIYDHLKENLKGEAVCHLSGTCSRQFHQHAEDPKEPEEDIKALVANGGDDIPCELCEQLVRHLREVLIANTTETEFKQVLQGLCKQTKGFKDECLSIVDQYYDIIYQTLSNELKEKEACELIGVCPRGSLTSSKSEIRPLLPVFPPAEIKVTIRKKLGASEPKFTEEQLYAMQLPIDRLMGAANPSLLVGNGQLCTLCEYFIHFLQEEMSLPKTEEELKAVINGVCDRFPTILRGKCHDFVEMYGDAIVALLIQGLDARTLCPELQLCPHNENQRDIEVFSPSTTNVKPKAHDESDKPTCPLCLFAVEQAQQKIKNDKSKRNIKNVLDQLCVHLPNKLKGECVDFVETYTNELVDMLITDFKPEEICVSLKLCPNTNNYLQEMGLTFEDSKEDSDIDSSEEAFNEISSDQDEPVAIVFDKDPEIANPNCLLCEELVKIVEKKINKHTTKEDIENALQHSCDKLRKRLQPKCHHYVDRYGDKIAELLLKEMEPKLICAEIGLCISNEQEDLEIDEAFKYDVIAMPNDKVFLRKSDRLTGLDDTVVNEPPSCVLCEFVMTKLEMELKNKTEQDEIKKAIETICNKMPKTVSKTCDQFVDQYGNAIFALIGSVPPKEVCQKIMLCFPKIASILQDEVIECGVCHGATNALLSFFAQSSDHSDVRINDMIVSGCADLPAKYYQICSEMVSVYGQSILNLYKKHDTNESHICSQIGKCFDNENSALAFAKISA